MVGIGWLPCLSLSVSHCWVLLLCFFLLAKDAWLMQMYQDTILHNITLYMNVGCWLLIILSCLPFAYIHARTHLSHAMPKCVYKMQFLSSFLFCPNSVCNLNSIGLYCIAIFLLVFTVLLFPFHALKCFMCFFLFYMIVIIILIIIVINICVCVLLLNGKIHAAFAKRVCSV